MGEEGRRKFFEEYRQLCLKHSMFLSEHWINNHKLFIRSQDMGSMDFSEYASPDRSVDDKSWREWIEDYLQEVESQLED